MSAPVRVLLLAAPIGNFLDDMSPAAREGLRSVRHVFVEELDVGAIAEREGTNPNNVYQWKNRIVQAARAVLVKGGWLSGDDT